jgi:hypothetical protein
VLYVHGRLAQRGDHVEPGGEVAVYDLETDFHADDAVETPFICDAAELSSSFFT